MRSHSHPTNTPASLPPTPLSLFTVAETRRWEAALCAALPAHTLMERAANALVQWIEVVLVKTGQPRPGLWFACGAGNNGGDGLRAATLLHARGFEVWVSSAVLMDSAAADTLPEDASWALRGAQEAGLAFVDAPPKGATVWVDALFGIGLRAFDERAGSEEKDGLFKSALSPWLCKTLARFGAAWDAGGVTILSVDAPSGLLCDSGQSGWGEMGESGDRSEAVPVVRAHHTLALLTAKPGYWMQMGRLCTGDLWFDALAAGGVALRRIAGQGDGQPMEVHAVRGVHEVHEVRDVNEQAPELPLSTLHLMGGFEGLRWPDKLAVSTAPSEQHKGSYGSVLVIGGDQGMAGAVFLAALTALCAGAGRVWLAPLHPLGVAFFESAPELMLANWQTAPLAGKVLVAGCGGGNAIAEALPRLLLEAESLVLDADALNAISRTEGMSEAAFELRWQQGKQTVLTPHPLEAARLLGCGVDEVQRHRLDCARKLAQRFQAFCVLKGAGTLLACPNGAVWLCPLGNAKLATAGTGDVLAGLIGAALAQAPVYGWDTPAAVTHAVYAHALQAEKWPQARLNSSQLARSFLQPFGF